MSDFQFRISTKAGLARIDLNRPEEGNALTRPMMVQLADDIASAVRPESTRLLVIEGRGTAFCRGRDGRGESSEGLNPWQVRTELMGAVLGVYDAIAAAPVPVVALVQGTAIGFGAALAGACDITIASDCARFSLPEIRHKIAPTLAMAALHRKLSPKVLSWLIYTGEELDAETAREVGLVSRVLPDGNFAQAADRFIDELATRPRLVLQTIKHFQKSAADAPGLASDYAGALLALVRGSV